MNLFLKLTMSGALAVGLLTGCGQKDTPAASGMDEDPHAGHNHGAHEGHDHGEHATHGPHGGQLVEVGAHLAHLEVLHDPDAKTITIHVLGPHAEHPLELPEAPKLNLRVNGAPEQVVFTGSASSFTATHEALAGEPEGHIALNYGGKAYRLPIAHSH